MYIIVFIYVSSQVVSLGYSNFVCRSQAGASINALHMSLE